MKSFDTKQPRSSASIGRTQWALSIAPHGEGNTKGGRSIFVDLCYDDFPMLRITPAANGAHRCWLRGLTVSEKNL